MSGSVAEPPESRCCDWKTIVPPEKQMNDRKETTLKTTHTPAFAALRRGRQNLLAAALVGVVAFAATIAQAADPLASWNDGPAKQAIVEFVKATTTQGSPQFVPPRSALPRLIRTARYGSSIRSIRR